MKIIEEIYSQICLEQVLRVLSNFLFYVFVILNHTYNK